MNWKDYIHKLVELHPGYYLVRRFAEFRMFSNHSNGIFEVQPDGQLIWREVR